MHFEKDKNLQNYNSLACPSEASYFCEPTSIDEVKAALTFCNEKKLPIYVLGGGSNVISQQVIRGCVIHPQLRGIQKLDESETEVTIEFAAGENWHQSVEWAVANNYYGLECLALIPGNIGAAPIQNIGAYGVELDQLFVSLDAVSIQSQALRTFTREECVFGYRDSIFKQDLDQKYVITAIRLRLKKIFQITSRYPALTCALKSNSNVCARDVMNTVISLRKQKLPDPLMVPNAGSFFKNPIVRDEYAKKLKMQFPSMVMYEDEKGYKKIPAAWLIDTCKLKGKEVGGLVVHEKQALVLTNPEKKSIGYVLDAANVIKETIANTFSIELEIEPRILGESNI